MNEMSIAIIGTGNKGGALATNWSCVGLHIQLGVNKIQEYRVKGPLFLKSTRI